MPYLLFLKSLFLSVTRKGMSCLTTLLIAVKTRRLAFTLAVKAMTFESPVQLHKIYLLCYVSRTLEALGCIAQINKLDKTVARDYATKWYKNL